MYANYSHFIDRAEVRIFAPEQSLEAEPLARRRVRPRRRRRVAAGARDVRDAGARAQVRAARVRQRRHVRRDRAAAAVDRLSRDRRRGRAAAASRRRSSRAAREQTPAPYARRLLAGAPTAGAPYVELPETPLRRRCRGDVEPRCRRAATDRALRVAYGENELGLRNIPLASGSVTVRGNAIPAGHQVYVAGRQVPVADDGSFVAQEILPSGVHTVEVAVLDAQGNGELYLRDIELERKDWFYVGMADLTLTSNDTNGPIELLQGENSDLRLRLLGRRAARVLLERQVQRALATDGERRHARRAARGALQQLPRQVAGVAVPPHRSRLPLPDVRRRRHGRGDGADARQVLREGRARRELRRVGQLPRRLHEQRARASRPRALRREAALRVATRDELRRAALRDRRLHGGARHDREPRGVSRHGRLAVLPAASGPPGRLRARAHRVSRSGVGARHGRRQSDAGRSTTTSTTCRAGCCSPSRSTRRATTTCSCATARSRATRRTSSCATSTRRASTRSTRCRPARKATTGSASA